MTSASQYASLQLAINFKGQRVMMPQPQLNRPIDPTSRSLSDSAQLLVSLCKLISWLFGKLYSSSIHCNGEDWTNVNHLYLFLPCIVLGYFSKAQNSQTDVCAQIFLIKLQQVEFPDWIYLGYFVFQGCQDSVEGSQRKIEVRNKDDTGCNIHRLSTRAACRRALGQVSTPVDFRQYSVSNHLVLIPKHSWKTWFSHTSKKVVPAVAGLSRQFWIFRRKIVWEREKYQDYTFMIYALLSGNFVVAICALFPQNFGDGIRRLSRF